MPKVTYLLTIIFALQLYSFNPGVILAQDKNDNSGKPVIGVILPFSSAFSDIALEQQKAIMIGAEKYNQLYELVFKDGGADKQSAVNVFQELIRFEDKLHTVISCSSWASDAIHPLAAEENIFHIAIGSAALDRKAENRTVRFTLDAVQEQRQLNEYLESFERIAVMGMDNNLGKSWIEMLKNRFPDRIVADHVYDPQQLDIRTKLKDIYNSSPDALVLISAGEAAEIAKKARLSGINSQLVGTRPIERSELLNEPEFTNGLVYTYPSYNLDHSFIADFEALHQEIPGFFGVEAFDAITTLSQAMENGLSRPDELFRWYEGKIFTGALGRVEFNAQGDASYPYLYKEIAEGKFKVADFQFPMLLKSAEEELTSILAQMDKNIAKAAKKLSHTGLTGPEASKILQNLYSENPYAFNSVSVDRKGIIKNVAPDIYEEVIGKDISNQEQIIRLHETQKPVLSQAIPMVEGFVSIDLEYPVFDSDNEFIGSVSILLKPEFFASVIEQKVYNFPVEMLVLQTDGTIIYEINEEEIGKNAFYDPMYEDFPSVIKVARKMVKEPEGKGEYRFMDAYMDQIVEKKIIWTSIGLHGTEYRLGLIYSGS
ncbi:ABC transporter substrate-binding protein [Desulfonatronovibrio magnus]|uniref:ABC transporter substrate-binding protein n=1 Tax=Desulfonatronovibrio magnus TaxID=698827 RepID=UPI0005EAF44D|nr:ABC transporter substrate-binding protein [Desulfonatronovibrio magnus]